MLDSANLLLHRCFVIWKIWKSWLDAMRDNRCVKGRFKYKYWSFLESSLRYLDAAMESG
jgi:hypothetical protein